MQKKKQQNQPLKNLKLQVMKQYLRLKFTDARWFNNPAKGTPKSSFPKDYITNTFFKGKLNRDDSYRFIEPITSLQVSNMLHVLFGERPVTTFRDTVASRIEYLFEKANDSLIRYNVAKKTSGEYITEFKSTKKSANNSWNPIPTANWNLVRERYKGCFLEEFFEFIFLKFGINNKEYKNFVNYRDVICELTKEQKGVILEKSKEVNLLGFARVLVGNYEFDKLVTSTLLTHGICVVNGVDHIVNLSGEILVPVDENDIEKIKLFKGTCTILDGGLVEIAEILNEDEIQLSYFDTFTKVKDISLDTETYKV
jgi:hypothetical protein